MTLEAKISLCIATYRRPVRLRALLNDVVAQQRPPSEIIVVDNDAAGSARSVIEQRRRLGTPCPIHYSIQPAKNISLTRNRTVELASGDWLAFIDDDERAPATWLRQLFDAAERYETDGVLGPVIPVVPNDAPSWIRSSFYAWARMQTGDAVPRNRLRFGNVLLRASLLKQQVGPFDPAYGLTGGEDGDLLSRLVNDGARIVWCDQAVVHEPVESSRLLLRWLLRRALRGGQDFARHTFAGRYRHISTRSRSLFFLRSLAQLLLAVGLMLVCLPFGRHRVVFWLLKAAANAGKLSVFWGWHYREYGGAPA